MNDLLLDCISSFGPAPREFSFFDRMLYMRVARPSWASADKLNILFQNLPTLFTEGTVVWGHVVQANSLLFKRGAFDCPGEVVFSLADQAPEHLAHIANELFSLKGTRQRDFALAHISNYLANQRMRVFGLAVPDSISPLFPCQISTTFFVRKHLPRRRLLTTAKIYRAL